ncbi:sodium-dependent transporter [Streptomyces sp. ODS28]|uniref:sodium-dependent transporter n=1 Tax=Streptomyces sp. ODS28 TaxID=3136688 RepID=UPI0031ECB724
MHLPASQPPRLPDPQRPDPQRPDPQLPAPEAPAPPPRSGAPSLVGGFALLKRHLGWAVTASYAAAALVPGLGLWLRAAHRLPGVSGLHLSLHVPELLLSLVLFTAGLQVPLEALGQLLRRPGPLLAGLALHLAAPLLVVPPLAFALRGTPDTDGGSGMVAAIILIVAMPVAAGATVWTTKGDGDQPTMVGLVLGSTLLSPLTVPLTVSLLAPLLRGGYADDVTFAGQVAGSGFAVTGVLLPCGAGLLCRCLLPLTWRQGLLRTTAPAALLGSLLLTYLNACGALGAFLSHPRPLLLAGALGVAAAVCGLSFATGRFATRILRMDALAGNSVTLACGMNNSSASAVLISTALPGRPHILLPVLAYSLLQKLAASRVVRVRKREPEGAVAR